MGRKRSERGISVPNASESIVPPSVSPRATRRRQDTLRFIERFKALTGYAVHSDSMPSLPREFLDHAVPSPDRLLRDYGPELALRTRNALCRFEPDPKSDRWTFERLLWIRGFGVLSLLDLLEVLLKHGVLIKD
jgi:hypothetical protein